MSLTRKLTHGVFYLLSSSLASIGLNVIIVAFIARKLDVENFGLYSAILSFAGLFQFLSDFGLNKTLLKFGSTNRTKTQISFGNALFLKGVLIVPLFGLVTLVGILSGYRNVELLILELFTASLILDSYGTVFSSIRRILGHFELISFFRIVRTLIGLAVVIFALMLNNSVLYLAISTTALSLVVFILSLFNTILLLRPRLDLSLMSEFFKDSLIFGLNDFFLNIYGKISTVLLSFFQDLHSVGIYSAAIKFTNIANLLPKQVRFALLPTMYRLLEDKNNSEETEISYSSEKSKKVFLILLKYMAIFSTILVILIFYFSGSIIHLVFGTKYDLSIPLVQLFSVFIYLRFIGTPFTLYFLGLNKHKNMVFMQGVATLLLVALNIILIPKYSFYGACIATIISELFLELMLIIYGIRFKIWDLINVFILLAKPLISGILSVWIIVVFLTSFNLFFKIIILLFSYVLFLIVMRHFGKEDKRLFAKIFVTAK